MAESPDARDGTGRRRLLVAGMLLVAVNLRAALASVGPLVEPIRQQTGMSAAAFGSLTTLPLIAFGLVSAFAPVVTRRLGLRGALVLALALIAGGTAARPAAGVALLFAGTAAIGVGVALGNVLLPALVKRDFSSSSGGMTSLYSSFMGIGATVAAGVTVPLAGLLGWRGALGVWAVPAAVALAFWIPGARRRPAAVRTIGAIAGLRALGRSPMAWQIALFMGFQSLTFYVILAWLPELLQSRGMSAAAAGGLLALSQATGIAGSALVPLRAGRRLDQRGMILLLAGLEVVGLLGLLLPVGDVVTAACVAILGFVMGGTFALALLFLVLRAPDSHTATSLSGMAQSVGYLIAAVGPALIGYVHDATGGWTVPVLLLFAALSAKIASGLGAARNRTV